MCYIEFALSIFCVTRELGWQTYLCYVSKHSCSPLKVIMTVTLPLCLMLCNLLTKNHQVMILRGRSTSSTKWIISIVVGYVLIVILHYLTLQEDKVSRCTSALWRLSMTDKVFFLSDIICFIFIARKASSKLICSEQRIII